ncbi:MAG: hypothetical protein OJF50_005210 [Nitrospira sp.]|jgi:hypothetical protein|nr:hypothetical protein [Nitrospira sp.]
MAAGYKVNIGLAIASGAAAGGIIGGAGAQWGQLGAFAAAPAAGASAAAISGSDPGIGAAIAAATSAFAMGLTAGHAIAKNWDMIITDLAARQKAAILHQFAEQVDVCSAGSGCAGPRLDVPVRGGIVGESRGLWTPANISIEATVLRLQLQYTMGQGLTASNVFPGGLGFQMQMSIVSPGAQPFGIGVGPLTVYGTYNGGNFHFRGTGISGGWEMLGNVPQVSTPR